MDSSLDSTRPGVYVPIQDGKQNYRYVEYLGDPELQPVRSNEITFLVRALYKLCTFLNNKVGLNNVILIIINFLTILLF